MHLRGLRGTFDEEGMPVYSPPPASDQFPTMNGDWTGVIKTAIQTWGTVSAAESQAKAQIAVAPYQYRYGTYPGYIAPGSAPYGYAPSAAPGYFLGISLGTWLIGAATVAIIYAASQR